MKLAVVSLGCPKNLTDTEIMLGKLLGEDGHVLTQNEQDAEVLLLNTCAFLEASRKESKDHIRRIALQKKKGKCKYILVAGCLPGREGEKLLDEFPEVDAIVSSQEVERIGEALRIVQLGRDTRPAFVKAHARNFDEKAPRLKLTAPHTAYIKISEGCDHICTFCVIPQIRGKHQSRPIESIVAEVTNLAENFGTVEVNLVAQDSTMYGQDLYGKPALDRLLAELAKIPKLRWIRIMYAYPHQVTDSLLDVIASEPKVCNYLDLPLQHASGTILHLMRRGGDRGYLERLIGKIRGKVPGITIRSTFIVGFPGEKEEHFEELISFLRSVALERVGFFMYSREEGSEAEALPDQVPERMKKSRLQMAYEVQTDVLNQVGQSMVGRDIEVLVDRITEHGPVGRTAMDAPDIDGSVWLAGNSLSPGDMVSARVTAAQGADLWATCTP